MGAISGRVRPNGFTEKARVRSQKVSWQDVQRIRRGCRNICPYIRQIIDETLRPISASRINITHGTKARHSEPTREGRQAIRYNDSDLRHLSPSVLLENPDAFDTRPVRIRKAIDR